MKIQIRLIFFLNIFFLVNLSLASAGINTLYIDVERLVAKEKFDEAISLFTQNKKLFKKVDSVQYHLELGILYQLAGKYTKSNQFLASAEDRMEKLYTKSITKLAGSLFTNDRTLPFSGEDFEKAIVNLISAINYCLLEEWDAALVEMRKVDVKLNTYNSKYENKNVYKEDAFIRYLGGVIYENSGELDDALIDYRKSYDTYKDYKINYDVEIPMNLKIALLRLTKKLDFKEEFAKYSREFEGENSGSVIDNQTTENVIVISYEGLSPLKKEDPLVVPVSSGGIPSEIKIAFPKFIERNNPVSHSEVRVVPEGGKTFTVKMDQVDDISKIAVKDLKDHMGRIKTKAILRRTTKFVAGQLAKKQASDNFGFLGGLIVGKVANTLANASEKIDERSWRLLPGNIKMAVIPLAPGSHDIFIDYYSKQGVIIKTKKIKSINTISGKSAFIVDRYSPNSGFDPEYSPTPIVATSEPKRIPKVRPEIASYQSPTNSAKDVFMLYAGYSLTSASFEAVDDTSSIYLSDYKATASFSGLGLGFGWFGKETVLTYDMSYLKLDDLTLTDVFHHSFYESVSFDDDAATGHSFEFAGSYMFRFLNSFAIGPSISASLLQIKVPLKIVDSFCFGGCVPRFEDEEIMFNDFGFGVSGMFVAGPFNVIGVLKNIISIKGLLEPSIGLWLGANF